MMIEWKENLINDLAHKRCVIFIGSGISATAKNKQDESPLTWGKFLEKASSLSNGSSNEFIQDMIKKENYLLALQAIKESSDPGDYSNFLKDNFSRPGFEPSALHNAIKEINSKIVITTNFDNLYELNCRHGYTVANYYDPITKIISTIKSPENLIIKAHGSIEDTNRIIFTQKEFYNAKKEHADFYEIIKALFLTHTVVFLGYSLNDPDINLLLEIASHSNTYSNPHYVVSRVGVTEELKKHWLDCYNIYTLEYGPKHENLEENVIELKEKVLEYRRRLNLPQ
ncbi:SIR2 family protein [Lysinibacillus sphaericus]|uniref:SIR2 family protein n=1 Tax=Lysinibacillus sphaericus TaxID=1421 RepID=UPI001CBE8D87|nr:SIR2 family protein [Lysinibacillus sphaericus]